MKSRRKNPAAGAPPRVARRSHRWTFRIIALLIPLLLLATIEIFLRIAGHGYPTSFFLEQSLDGRNVLIDNWQFGWRFFPSEIARTPQPVVFPAHKQPGTIRIFVFGESAAMGDPEPAFGLPRMLQAMLEIRFPSNRFEVINVAMTAINSHVIREIAKDCARLEGDIWLIYMGNNEVVGPFGSGTVFSRQTPSLSFIRASLWLKQFRLVQWLSSVGQRGGPAEWEGMEMFLKQRVSEDDPKMLKVYAHFRQNLEDIVRFGSKSGARVIVGTVGVNLRDCPPFAPVHANTLDAITAAKFDDQLKRAVSLQREQRFRDAFDALREANRLAGANDHHGELHFQLGRCELALGSNAAARADFNAAKEYDTLRFRADDAINAAIKSAPAPARVIDTAELLAAGSSNAIPGAEMFYEHVHLTFEGTYWLARSFLDEVVRALPASRIGKDSGTTPTLEQCAGRLAWTDWDRLQVYEEVRKRLQQPPFTAQFGHEERDAAWKQRIESLDAGLTPERFREAVAVYEGAIRAAPGDWVLHEDLAKLLEENADTSGAIGQWQEVARLLPHDLQAQYHLGNLLDTLGRSGEALAHFHAALRRNPWSPEARNGLALALANLGRLEEAQREFQTVLRLRPRFTEARVNFGQLLARQGRTDDAVAQYEIALRHDTNSAAAHVNLGKLLAARGDKAEAMAHYEAALRSNPRHAIAHFNLGNALLATNPADAMHHYAEAVRARPNFAEAHLALALQLAKSGDAVAAEKHFAEAVRLQPNSAEAHFNYGVLLANQKRFADAAQQFSRTLELQPGNARAREFLDRVQKRR